MATPNISQLVVNATASNISQLVVEATASGLTAPKICERGGSGLFFPVGGDGEADWPDALKIILYMVGLGWCFLGVGIVSDVFMGAIETITAKKKRVYDKIRCKVVTVKVWNDTVANLTLMALGSSAPEILLSCIELLNNNIFTGDLGPATIVGSAAFNLLIITAVCIMAIGGGEVRRINDMSVFAVTGSCSILAYLWLLFILMVTSPDLVEVWEGVLTLLFFPILVAVAFAADRGMFSGKDKRAETLSPQILATDMDQDELCELIAQIRTEHDVELTDEQVTKLVEKRTAPKPSRAAYRVDASKKMYGAKKSEPMVTPSFVSSSEVTSVEGETSDAVKKQPPATVAFSVAKYAVMESKPSVKLEVMRSGPKSDFVVLVDFETQDGTAKAGSDYVAKKGTIQFDAGCERVEFDVLIKNDADYEDDEFFNVVLSNPRALNLQVVELGTDKVAEIAILDDDLPGVLKFDHEQIHVEETPYDHDITVRICRERGSSGTIGFSYRTESDTAASPHDYEHIEGTAELKEGEFCHDLTVKIMKMRRYERTEQFRIILADPQGGAVFCKDTDGGDDHNICTVQIEANPRQKDKVDNMVSALKMNWDKNRIGSSNWKDQFLGAFYCNGDAEAQAEAGVFDWVMHVISFPWKIMFALIPPTDFAGGWACFCSALAGIGLLTGAIGDLAALLGCSMGLKDSITAITFVALGTSLPDTFASKSAAEQDPYADASIGNVTGSNSVNVFLGLGLPWAFASIYWAVKGHDDDWIAKYSVCPTCRETGMSLVVEYPDGGFAVPSGSLGFSVSVFTICGLCCIATLVLRRKFCGGELGGPQIPKVISATFCASLWFLYVALCTWNVYSSD